MPPAIAAIALLILNLALILGATLLANSEAYGDCMVCERESETVVDGHNFCSECAERKRESS